MRTIPKICVALTGLFLLSTTAFGQWYHIDLDTQIGTHPTIKNVFSGNTPFLATHLYEDGTPLDMRGWTMTFYYSYGQFDTNGGVWIAGTVDTTITNRVNFLGATNVFFEPYDDYYWSVSGISSSSYTKTFGYGRMIQEYDPATGTNMATMMGQLNMSWWTNNMGQNVTDLQGRTSVWNKAGVDAIFATNWIYTNVVTAGASTNGLASTIFVTNAVNVATQAVLGALNDTNALLAAVDATLTAVDLAFLKIDGSRYATNKLVVVNTNVATTEVVLNGSFTGNAGSWSLVSPFTYAANQIQMGAGSGSMVMSNPPPTILGKSYRCSYGVTTNASQTASTITLTMGGRSDVFVVTNTETHYFYLDGMLNTNGLVVSASIGVATVYFDDLTMKEEPVGDLIGARVIGRDLIGLTATVSRLNFNTAIGTNLQITGTFLLNGEQLVTNQSAMAQRTASNLFTAVNLFSNGLAIGRTVVSFTVLTTEQVQVTGTLNPDATGIYTNDPESITPGGSNVYRRVGDAAYGISCVVVPTHFWSIYSPNAISVWEGVVNASIYSNYSATVNATGTATVVAYADLLITNWFTNTVYYPLIPMTNVAANGQSVFVSVANGITNFYAATMTYTGDVQIARLVGATNILQANIDAIGLPATNGIHIDLTNIYSKMSFEYVPFNITAPTIATYEMAWYLPRDENVTLKRVSVKSDAGYTIFYVVEGAGNGLWRTYTYLSPAITASTTGTTWTATTNIVIEAGNWMGLVVTETAGANNLAGGWKIQSD